MAATTSIQTAFDISAMNTHNRHSVFSLLFDLPSNLQGPPDVLGTERDPGQLHQGWQCCRGMIRVLWEGFLNAVSCWHPPFPMIKPTFPWLPHGNSLV